jgi:diaminohydroxyphosphoribosylaminopyrimidine deaminase/5-amino-6-(5-phosphoribosylamino)uracil reductase
MDDRTTGRPDDRTFMSRALRLASLSLGMTWPNPGVGCVLVRDGRLLGEGRHRRCGDLHAETAALADCRRRGNDARGATAYVTLAPCTRQGRQPPCCTALIAAGVARVVAAVPDPAQDEAGALLAAAGIAYASGCLGEAAAHLHGGFLHRVRSGRPRLTGKWAVSADGMLAAAPGVRTAISCPAAYALMRRRRRACDAVVVGAGTAAADDPALTAPRPRRHGDDAGPLRVVLTRTGAIPGLRLQDGSAPTLAVHAPGARPPDGAGSLAVANPHDPHQVALALGRLGLNEVMVEGGAAVHAAWLPLYDRLEIYRGAGALPGGLPGPPPPGPGWRPEQPAIQVGSTRVERWTRLP